MAFAITTFAPRAIPTNRLTISPITALFALTAATATVLSVDAKLPTTAISEALKSCSKTAVAATGSAKRGSLFQIEPFSISILLLLVLFIPTSKNQRTIRSVPAPMSAHPTADFGVNFSCKNTNASTSVITTLSLSIGTTFEASPICSAL